MDEEGGARDTSAFNSCNYSDSAYWNKRYTDDPKPFEWYQCYAGVSPLVRRFIPLSSRVLVVGCGNSVMSEDMVKDGYKDIINIDISPIVIEAMQKKYHSMPQLQYMTMDVLDMSSLDDCSFDAVIDKAQPGSRRSVQSCSKAYAEPVLRDMDGTYADKNAPEDMESHFVYMCTKES